MKYIVYKKEGGIARITFNRPEAYNALREELFDEAREALLDAEADDNIKVIIFNGAGKCWSAGMDLKVIDLDGFKPDGKTLAAGFAMSDLISNSKKVTIAQIQLSARLSRRIGVIKAKEMSFRAIRVKGAEAERIGLVNRAYKNEEELASEVDRIAKEICGHSFKAIQVTKELYDQRFRMDLDEGIAHELATDPTEMHTQEELMALIKKNLRQ